MARPRVSQVGPKKSVTVWITPEEYELLRKQGEAEGTESVPKVVKSLVEKFCRTTGEVTKVEIVSAAVTQPVIKAETKSVRTKEKQPGPAPGDRPLDSMSYTDMLSRVLAGPGGR